MQFQILNPSLIASPFLQQFNHFILRSLQLTTELRAFFIRPVKLLPERENGKLLHHQLFQLIADGNLPI